MYRALLRSQPSLSRDFFLLSGFILIVLLIAFIWSSYEIYQEHNRTIFEQLENEGLRIDRALIVEIENNIYLLESMGRQISSHYAPDDYKGVAQLLMAFTASNRNNVFFWTGANQMLHVSTNKGVLDEAVDVSDRDYIHASISTPWQVVIGRPVQGRVSEKWVLPLGLGLTDDTGAFIGTISVSMDIGYLTREIDTQIKHNGISFAILNSEFTPLTQWSQNPLFNIGAFAQSSLPGVDLTQAPSGILSQRSYLGNLLGHGAFNVFYERSSQYPFILVLGYSAELAADKYDRLLREKFLQLLLMAGIIFAFLWLVRQRVIGPVVQLSHVAEAVARGESFKPLAGKAPHEIIQLATHIRKAGDFIRERKLIEEELHNKLSNWRHTRETEEYQNRIKIRFFDSIGQDMHYGLHDIMQAAAALQDERFGPLENEKYRALARIIAQECGLLHGEINVLRKLAKAENGQSALSESPLAVGSVIQQVVESLRERFEKRQTSVNLTIQDNLPHLMANDTCLRQLLIHLLHYAVYISAPGSLLILETYVGQKDAPTTLFLLRCTVKEPPEPLSDPDGLFAGDHDESLANASLALLHMFAQMLDGEVEVSRKPKADRLITIALPKSRIVYRG